LRQLVGFKATVAAAAAVLVLLNDRYARRGIFWVGVSRSLAAGLFQIARCCTRRGLFAKDRVVHDLAVARPRAIQAVCHFQATNLEIVDLPAARSIILEERNSRLFGRGFVIRPI
jgi:hypothetical protein